MKKFIIYNVCMLIVISSFFENFNICTKTVYAQENDTYTRYDELEISDEYLELYVGESEELTIMTVSDGIAVTANWSSSNPSVATVSTDGIVTGKNPGTAIISGEIDKNIYKCVIHIKKLPPTYKEIVTKAKKYNSKHIKFKHIDVGYQSRLISSGGWGSKFEFEKHGYGIIVSDDAYIDIKKTENTANISLVIEGTHRVFATSSRYQNYTKLKLYTSNRKVTYNFASRSQKYKKYETTLKWKTKISSNSKISLEKLNKTIRMFEHKKINLKTMTDDGSGWTSSEIPESTRKHWLKLFKIYKKLLKLYE